MFYALRMIFVGVLIAACAFVLAQGSSAVNAPDAYGRVFVDVVGEILPDDDKAFQQKVANLYSVVQRNVIVTLASPGGDAVAAMAIGKFIRKRGWTTYVSSGIPCASSCSLIWLAGMPRTIDNFDLVNL